MAGNNSTTQVKICGITQPASLDAAVRAGADYFGLVFFPKSPRHTSLEKAALLAKRARHQSDIAVVALVVDASSEDLKKITSEVSPDIFQLHGGETRTDIAIARESAPDARIWKAVSVSDRSDVDEAANLLEPGTAADLILYDAKPPTGSDRPGGTGLTFDWTILTNPPVPKPFALAGGLTVDNVAEAVQRTGAPIVDVSSGVEVSRGVKSPELIARFIAAAKSGADA